MIYINDFTLATNIFSTTLFAYHTSLTITGKYLDEILNSANVALSSVYEWLCANKLTLNLNKTKYMVYQLRQKFDYNVYFRITLDGQYIEQAFSVKYLGLMIDNNLSWHDHIEYIVGKISKNINILFKVKSFLNFHSLISLYYALVYPCLTHGSILWANNYEVPLSSIVRLQNKVIRIINDVPLCDHITPHCAQLPSGYPKISQHC